MHVEPKAMEEMRYWVDRLPVKPTPAGPILDLVALYQLYKDQSSTSPEWLRKQRTMQDLELWSREVSKFQNKM